LGPASSPRRSFPAVKLSILVEINHGRIQSFKTRPTPQTSRTRRQQQNSFADHVPIVVHLHSGQSSAKYWTCDFTVEYVRNSTPPTARKNTSRCQKSHAYARKLSSVFVGARNMSKRSSKEQNKSSLTGCGPGIGFELRSDDRRRKGLRRPRHIPKGARRRSRVKIQKQAVRQFFQYADLTGTNVNARRFGGRSRKENSANSRPSSTKPAGFPPPMPVSEETQNRALGKKVCKSTCAVHFT